MPPKTPERIALETQAEELGVSFQANIGDEKLAERIEKAKAKANTPVPILRITGPKQGFRRAGRSFGAKPVDIPLDELSDKEIATLEGEPNLVTIRIGEAEPTD